jgi:hypothetical protein
VWFHKTGEVTEQNDFQDGLSWQLFQLIVSPRCHSLMIPDFRNVAEILGVLGTRGFIFGAPGCIT